VLVACEFSGIVRDAFRARGHDAWSCDLLPSERPGPHIRGDIIDELNQCEPHDWDLLIAHPPCTHLAVSGARWFAGKRAEQEAALEFVRLLLHAEVPRIALENPVSVISSRIRRPDQIIQPWQFGHPESKTTCLWLKGLPKLLPTDVLPLPLSGRWANQTPSGQNRLGPSPTRWADRSRTYVGIAAAMADQWGSASLAERGGTIPLDLPFGDDPCLADEPAPESSVVDLVAERGGGHPEPLGSLREGEHLADELGGRRGFEDGLERLGVAGPAGVMDVRHLVGVDGGTVGAEAIRGCAAGPALSADGLAGSGEFVHADKLDGIAYVVKGSAS
jgi:hypothetical protein